MKFPSLAAMLSSGAIVITAAFLPNPAVVAQEQIFFCGTDGQVPVTYATTPQGPITLIRWESDYFTGTGFPPQNRCQQVSERLQTYYSNGSLDYITTGIMNKESVVCVTSPLGGACQGLLFTLRPEDDASELIQKLFDIRSNVLPGSSNTPNGETPVDRSNLRRPLLRPYSTLGPYYTSPRSSAYDTLPSARRDRTQPQTSSNVRSPIFDVPNGPNATSPAPVQNYRPYPPTTTLPARNQPYRPVQATPYSPQPTIYNTAPPILQPVQQNEERELRL